MSAKVSLVKRKVSDNSKLPCETSDNVAPISNLLDSFWQSCDIYLNDTRITSNNEHRLISGHIGRLMSFPKICQSTYLATELCYPDEIDPDNTFPLENKGFAKRMQMFKKVGLYYYYYYSV
jgi:hypothetical protein